MTSPEPPAAPATVTTPARPPEESPVTMAVAFAQLAMAQLITHPACLDPVWTARSAKANPYLRDTLKQLLKVATPQLTQALAETPALPALQADIPFEVAKGLTALLPADPIYFPAEEPPVAPAPLVSPPRTKAVPSAQPGVLTDAERFQLYPNGFNGKNQTPLPAHHDDEDMSRWRHWLSNPPPPAA